MFEIARSQSFLECDSAAGVRSYRMIRAASLKVSGY